MARADLNKLKAEILKKIKEDPGAFRNYYVDLKELTIRNENKAIIDQCMKQMALREAYDTVPLFKAGLAERFPGENAFGKIERAIKDQVPPFNAAVYYRLTNETRKKRSVYKITWAEGHNKTNWTIDFAQKKGQTNLFKAYKKFKSNAQVGLINAINAWSTTKSGGGQARNARGEYTSGRAGGGAGDTYSRRGKDLTGATTAEGIKKQKTWNKKMGASVPVKSGGTREARREITTKGDTWIDQDGKEQISNANDPFLDLGHTEASVAGERLIQTRESFTDVEGRLPGAAGFKGGQVKEELFLRLSSELNFAGEGAKKFAVEWEASSLNKATGSDAKKEVTFLDRTLNSIINKLYGDMGTWANKESSDSFMQMTEKKLVEALVKPFRKNKKVKFSTRLKTNKQKNSKNTVKGTPHRPRRSKVKIAAVAFKKGKIIQQTRNKRKSKSGPANAPLFLLGIFNEQLPQMVESNMGTPALTNQTGRFASSVRATDIMMTPQGFPSFGYTYRRNPYGKFEQDSDYDPRKLIDRTMREIAAEYAMGRFYTRRV